MTTAVPRLTLLLLALFSLLGSVSAQAQGLGFFKPMKKASDLIHSQAPLKVFKENEEALTAENAHVEVSLAKQRAWLIGAEDKIYLDTPISSGKNAGMTPTGHFSVLEKDPDHRSNIFGAFCDNQNRIVRAGVSLKIDSAPSGTHYIGAPMKWFMRLTDGGVGMHVGQLPGYPASHGCVRLPEDAARMIYAKVKVGTPVTISP